MVERSLFRIPIKTFYYHETKVYYKKKSKPYRLLFLKIFLITVFKNIKNTKNVFFENYFLIFFICFKKKMEIKHMFPTFFIYFQKTVFKNNKQT